MNIREAAIEAIREIFESKEFKYHTYESENVYDYKGNYKGDVRTFGDEGFRFNVNVSAIDIILIVEHPLHDDSVIGCRRPDRFIYSFDNPEVFAHLEEVIDRYAT